MSWYDFMIAHWNWVPLSGCLAIIVVGGWFWNAASAADELERRRARADWSDKVARWNQADAEVAQQLRDLRRLEV